MRGPGVVAKQAADAKNAWYICKNNTLSFWGFFCLETRLTYVEYKTEQNKKDLQIEADYQRVSKKKYTNSFKSGGNILGQSALKF